MLARFIVTIISQYMQRMEHVYLKLILDVDSMSIKIKINDDICVYLKETKMLLE